MSCYREFKKKKVVPILNKVVRGYRIGSVGTFFFVCMLFRMHYVFILCVLSLCRVLHNIQLMEKCHFNCNIQIIAIA